MKNKVVDINNEDSVNVLLILKSLLRKSLLIILVTILFALIGFGFGVIRTKPVYVASRSVIFRTEIKDTENIYNDKYNEATLAKRVITTVSSVVDTPGVLTMATQSLNENINAVNNVMNDFMSQNGRMPTAKEVSNAMNGALSVARVSNIMEIILNDSNTVLYANSVGINYEIKSLIFTLLYSDSTKEQASEKLEVLIETLSDNLYKYVQAENVTLIITQNSNDISISFNRFKYVLIGGMIGFVGTVVLLLLAYVLDNTLKSKEELEQITGVDVLGVIEK